MGIKLSLWRHIAASHTRSSFSSHSSTLSSREQDNVKNYSEIIYKGEDFAFDNDDPRVVVLPVYIPSGVYSLRHTSYLHVQFFVQVSLMASMSKALAVELPIYITHASSWSDPPPRIPRDFTFPMHEDDPVKKNKTGVFSKMKSNSVPTHQNGSISGSGLKNSSGLTESSSNLSSLASAASSKSGTPNASSEATTLESESLRPSTRRSALKDPDSPTSVLDFSQAGNLFVVNPDSASICASSDSGFVVKKSMTSRPPPLPTTRDLESRPSSPEKPTSPLDRSAPLTLVDTLSPKATEEAEMKNLTKEEDEEQDFDMSRATNVSQTCSLTKRNSDKSDKSNKSGKMGLRKTLAKLSIAIPSHNNSSHHSGKSKSSKVSPRVLSSTPRSSKSLNLTGSEEMGSPSSDRGGRSLSRKSSSSSMGSFTHIFERHSCKSSTGSTRVVNVSPGSGSNESGSLPLCKMSSSSNGSEPQSNTTSAYPSRSSSPALLSASSSAADSTEEPNMRERHHEIGQLAMTPAIPDVRLHSGTPMKEEMGREGCFEANDDQQQSRPTTPGPSETQFVTLQSSPATPNSTNRPWDMPRNFSTTSLASSSPSEGDQSAQEIRDEYYYGRSSLSRNMSVESLEARIAPPQGGKPAEDGGAELYTTNDEIYDDSPVPMPGQGHGHGLEASREIYESTAQQQVPTCDVVGDGHLAEHRVVQDVISHQQQQLQQEQVQHLGYQQQQQQQVQHQQDLQYRQPQQANQQQQQSLISGRYEEPATVPAIIQPPVDFMLNQHQDMEGYASIPPSAQHSPVRLNEVPTSLVLPPIQSPEAFRPLQARTLSHHSSRAHSRSSSSHSIVYQTPGDLSGVSTPRSASSLQQMENLSRSSSPMVRDPILRNTSMENVATFERSASGALSHTYQQQTPMTQDLQLTISREGQFTPEIYSTPILSQNEPMMESNIINNSGGLGGTYSISAAIGFSQPTTPLSTSTSFQSDNLRLTPNDLGVSMQIGGGGMRDQQQQQFHFQASSATGYSGAPAYRESKYSATLQPDVYSPHPSRSNSRQVSPKQWHTEALLPAQHIVVPPQQQQQQSIEAMAVQVVVQQVTVPRQPSLDRMTASKQVSIPSLNEQDGEHFIVVDASKPPGVAYQAVVDYQAAEMQATTPVLTDDQQSRFESQPLQHSIYKDEARQAPYQPRTEYLPAFTSVAASASSSASVSPSRLEFNAHSPPTVNVAGGGESYANANYLQLTQPGTALGGVPVSMASVVSPPPIPGRPWSQVPPVTFGGVPASVSVRDHQTHLPLSSGAPYQPQSSYVGITEQVPTSQRSAEDVAAVAMALRAHQDTVDRQEELARQQEELARQQEVLAHQEAIARQEAIALTQQQQEALARQNAIAQQEAFASQEALAQQDALVYQQKQQEQHLQQHQQAQQLQQQQQFQHEQQQLLWQQQQQLQGSTRFSGGSVGGGSPVTSSGPTLEIPVISPPASQPVLQNPGLVRGPSDQELAGEGGGGAYRMSPRGYGGQEMGVGVGGQTTPGGSSLVIPPDATSDLAEAIRSIQSSPVGSGSSAYGAGSQGHVYRQQLQQQQQQVQHGLTPVPSRAVGDDVSIIDENSRRASLLVGAGGDGRMLSGSGDKEEFDEGRWM